MLLKDIDYLSESDIEYLCAGQVSEHRTLDYKDGFPDLSKDVEKREFLADVSSFANTSGGHLLFGVQEARNGQAKLGYPGSINGVTNLTIDDSTVLRVEQIIRTGLEPPLAVRSRILASRNRAGPVFIIQVPESPSAPHMVRDSRRFHARGSNGKYEMGVEELRTSFSRTGDTAERVRTFRSERVSNLTHGVEEWHVKERYVVLHVVPLSAFRYGWSVDARALAKQAENFQPLSERADTTKFNLEGFRTAWIVMPESGSQGYVQAYRNGIVEAVDTWALGTSGDDSTRIPVQVFEPRLIAGVRRYLDALRNLGFQPPIAIMTTLVNVKGLSLATGRVGRSLKRQGIDRAVLNLPEAYLEDFTVPSEKLLRPVFDAFYNSAGWERCLSYDESGNWKQPN